ALCNLEVFMSDLKKKGYFLSVITNAAEAPTLIQLEKLSCLHLFDEVIGCDSGFKPKPSGDTILGFCDAFGLKPNEIAMVGDSTHDLNAGRNAGVGLNVGVLSGPANIDQISGLADVVLDDILGLPEIL
ncbi:HAD-IA family hydrolase, partial [Amylibacter sp.]|nr:HAD-IA family hydrolase [Amylibacter sp.]